MDTRNVKELIDLETEFLKSWEDCMFCDVNTCFIDDIEDELGRKWDCQRDCENYQYTDLEDNFINFLIVRLIKRIKEIEEENNDEITTEELELLKFLYQIYKDIEE